MNEDRLREFRPAEPPPGLKERVLEAARNAPAPPLIDRLWTRGTWLSLAAALLVSLALSVLSAAPPRTSGGTAPSVRTGSEGPTLLEARREAETILRAGGFP